MTSTAQAQTEAIRQATDLASVVAAYGIALRRTGHALVACCPFHCEKTPSFTVSPSKNLYKCFGCGAGGDAFTFVQRIEGVDFMRARTILADLAGVPLDAERWDRRAAADYRHARVTAEDIAYFAIREHLTLGLINPGPADITAAYARRCAADPSYRQWLRDDRRQAEDITAAIVLMLANAAPFGRCRRCGAAYARDRAHWQDGQPWCGAACWRASRGLPAPASVPITEDTIR